MISRIIGNENDSAWFEHLNFTEINRFNSFVIDDQTSSQLRYEEQEPIFRTEAKLQMLAGLTLFEYIHYLDSSIGSISWEDSLLHSQNQKLSSFLFSEGAFGEFSDYSYLEDPNDYNRNFMLYFHDHLSDFNAYNEAVIRFLKNSTAAVNYAEHVLWALIQSYNPVLVASGRRSLRDSDDTVAVEVTQTIPPYNIRQTLNENEITKREIHNFKFGCHSIFDKFS